MARQRSLVLNAVVQAILCASACGDSGGGSGDMAESGTDGGSTCIPGDPEQPCPEGSTDVVVPFFRGTYCTVTQAGPQSPIPVLLSPCTHPCLDIKDFRRKHFFGCIGTDCDGWFLLYMIADKNGCTGDEWSAFTPSPSCYADLDSDGVAGIEFSFSAPVAGNFRMTVPYLSNADVEELATYDDPPSDLVQSLIDQHPEDPTRRRSIVVQDGFMAPEMCAGDDACTCTQIGFE